MNNHSLVGREIDEYRLTALLGEGGMASVYRAVDSRLKRDVAIKVIRASFRSDSMYMERFEREAQAVAQLQHPNIITIYRYGQFDEGVYMAMQFIDGADLAAVIDAYREDGAFIEFEQLIKLAHEIGAGLDYAHSKGVIHRDIKPHNIMINKDEHAIVTDFGLVLLTEMGTRGEIFGSPHYIAPEQAISSAKVVPQSDLYALGVMLYEMLTGTLPFDAAEPMDIAMKHMTEPVPSPRSLRPELSEAAEAVLLKALDKEPGNRYESGKALAHALEQALKSETGSKPAPAAKPLSKMSISQRLAMEFDEGKASPTAPKVPTPSSTPKKAELPAEIPPAVRIAQAPKTQPTVEKQSASKLPVYLLLGLGALLVLGVLAFLLLPNLLTGNIEAQATEITDETAVFAPTTAAALVATETIASSTNTSTPSETASPTSSPSIMPTLEPTNEPVLAAPSNAPQSYHLVISWVGEDSLFIINEGELAFPLSSLELRGGNSVLSGSEWGIGELAQGQCVAVWKDGGNPNAADSSCQQVGARITRDGPNRFWKNSFDVYFNGNRFETCEASPCSLEIPQ
jgi:serine/threonine protein kinase